MSTQKELIQQLAAGLSEAERTKRSIPPLTKAHPELTADDAYAIQLINVSKLLSQGAVISGKKIGLTSPGMQQLLGVNEPDYGHLFSFMDCAQDIRSDELIQPKIEAEIAFLLGEDLPDRDVTKEEVLSATKYICAAFEIVDSRVADWKIKLADTISDNASSGRYVLGTDRISPSGLDLAAIVMRTEQQGKGIVSEGIGAAVMGDPAASVAWLANCLRRYGVSLKKGEVVLSGAFAAALPAKKGDVFTAAFTALGTVTARFV